MYILVPLIIIGIILIYFLFFRVIEINGVSMFPTYKHGEYSVVTRVFNGHKFQVGNIYVYKNGDRHVCKRLVEIKMPEVGKDKLLYFLGDNTDDSYDSRHYGYVKEHEIKYRFFKSRENPKEEAINE